MKAHIGDIDIHYEISGQGPWITLSHSLAAHGGMWAPQVAALSARYSILPESGGLTRFTVPINCSPGGRGQTIPYDVYIFDWPRDYSPVRDQLKWAEIARGCSVADDIETSFARLYEIARENNVSFVYLTDYAIGAAQQEQPAAPSPVEEQ
jgi:hypothetical protein